MFETNTISALLNRLADEDRNVKKLAIEFFMAAVAEGLFLNYLAMPSILRFTQRIVTMRFLEKKLSLRFKSVWTIRTMISERLQ